MGERPLRAADSVHAGRHWLSRLRPAPRRGGVCGPPQSQASGDGLDDQTGRESPRHQRGYLGNVGARSDNPFGFAASSCRAATAQPVIGGVQDGWRFSSRCAPYRRVAFHPDQARLRVRLRRRATATLPPTTSLVSLSALPRNGARLFSSVCTSPAVSPAGLASVLDGIGVGLGSDNPRLPSRGRSLQLKQRGRLTPGERRIRCA